MPVGAPTLLRGAALRRGDLPHAEEDPARAQARDGGRRRGRLRAEPAIERGGARGHPAGVEKAGYKLGKQNLPRPRRREHRVLQERQVRPRIGEGRKLHAPRVRRTISPSSSRRYPIITIEDGMGEGDWDGWATLTEKLGKKVQLVGDDLFVTNTKILQGRHRQEDRQRHPDQGEPDRHAHRDAGGHRDGDRCGLLRRSCRIARARPRTRPSPTSPWRRAATQIKTGSMSRSDRIAKYNQLLRIEAVLGSRAKFNGAAAFPV